MEAIIFAFVAVSGWLVALSLAVRWLNQDVDELKRRQTILLNTQMQFANDLNELEQDLRAELNDR